MKFFISGLMALSLMGCSLLKFNKSDVPPPPEPAEDVRYTEESGSEDSVTLPEIKVSPRKAPASIHPPLGIKESELPKPCRNIVDDDIWQELRQKLSCIEENVK